MDAPMCMTNPKGTCHMDQDQAKTQDKEKIMETQNIETNKNANHVREGFKYNIYWSN